MSEEKIRDAFQKVRDDISEVRTEMKKLVERVNNLSVEVSGRKKSGKK